MAKFGQFSPGGSKPTQEFEGDYMIQKDEYVYIKKRVTQAGQADEQTAAIKLADGQSVKKISD
jgi:hypothetical protein